MKQLFIKISSFTLAFLVLFSTFSFTVEKHYCGDFLVDVSFIGDLEICSNDIASDHSIQMKKCCKDEVQKFEGQDELQQNSIEKLDFKKQQFLTAFVIFFNDLFVETESINNFYKDFSPPDIPLDYQISYQTFLI